MWAYIYDAATQAAYTAATGLGVPAAITSLTQTLTTAQLDYVDWCSGQLGAAMLALRDHVRSVQPAATVRVLIFTPQVVDAASTLPQRLNLPASWAYPAFDTLQLEDYDHVTAGAWGLHRSGLDTALALLAYPAAAREYFSGFVLDPEDTDLWTRIVAALGETARRGFAQQFIWACPQVCRDGFSYADLLQDDSMTGFHDLLFPLSVGLGASGGPEFSTDVITTASGYEQRLSHWSRPRYRFDAGLGVRSEDDLRTVLAFFNARLGRAYGFRFRDPLDSSSANGEATPSPLDQPLGVGDGLTTDFALGKHYVDLDSIPPRRITHPVDGTIRVAVDGVEATTGWTWDATDRVIRFTTAPASGAILTAGFRFDVPVRFAADELDISLETFRAGLVASVPLVEIAVDNS